MIVIAPVKVLSSMPRGPPPLDTLDARTLTMALSRVLAVKVR
jgi:hypothetical protein